MVINETKKEFGFKLLNHYSDLMKEHSKDSDLDSKLYAFTLLLRQSGKTLNALSKE